MPVTPATSAPGRSSTEASVSTFMISLVRWLVAAMSTSKEPDDRLAAVQREERAQPLDSRRDRRACATGYTRT